jgi:hypothetical protein
MQNNYQQFTNSGIAIIPITYKDKRPNSKLLPHVDNHPSWEPFKTRMPTSEEIVTWFGHQINYGVVMGWRDLVVIDFDDMTEYINWQQWATRRGETAHMVARLAYKVKTARGIHVYVRLPGAANQKIGKIDVKANGYVLGPGSIHPTGAIYTAMQTALVLPVVGKLSDILPEQEHKLVSPSKPPMPITPLPNPFDVAMQPSTPVGLDAVARIKAKFNILDFFPAARSHDGVYYHACCPWHDDKHASLWIDKSKQICKCWACGGKALDVISVYARFNNLDNRSAIQFMESIL